MIPEHLIPWLDKINALIEFGILIPFVMDCAALVRAKDSRAISLTAQWTYGAYCCWWAIYFSALGQWWSLAAVSLWIAGYAIKIVLVMRYRPVLQPAEQPR